MDQDLLNQLLASQNQAQPSPQPDQMQALQSAAPQVAKQEMAPNPASPATQSGDVITNQLLAQKEALSKPIEAPKPSLLANLLTGLGAGMQKKDASSALADLQAGVLNPWKAQQEYKAANATKLADVNSELNKRQATLSMVPQYKAALTKLAPSFGIDPKAVDAMSPDAIVQFGPTLEKMGALQNTQSEIANRATEREQKTRALDIEDQKAQAMKQYHQDTLAARLSNNADKQDQAQAKNYSDMRTKMESFRGNQGVQQASVAVGNADRALRLIKTFDPNKLTNQDINLFMDEMGKVATGGVPTEGQVKNLLPDNLQQKWTEMKNYLTSHPTPADQGEYIKRNAKYLEDMRDSAMGKLTDFRRNIAHGYKNRVNAADYEEAMKDYNITEPGASSSSAPSAPTSHDDLNKMSNEELKAYLGQK